MTELPQLLDRCLAERGMTREEFAERGCKEGFYDTTSEVLEEFDATTETYVNIVGCAEDICGLSEEQSEELWGALMRDARKRLEANRQARSN